ncbi:DegV family protein [Alkaliphilus peptidifermentans]|uniref:EDD domain protein, DegV family n=1 Tax=Alkaliphilus peptidifermentans DSM 18978 TaxID=1120976 RepID=A0A1G5HS54_9FIRM|nr:DegV family protein [Alkaliphilus peptidifermentans]SCY66583.1 EDD domain protein, DegV family [Alkaliphilus peptidifermentans DSM 18978]
MSKIQLVIDSTAYISKDFAKKHDIKMVPLSVNFEGTLSEEGFPGEFDEFFERLANSNDFPTTSQPSAGAFLEVFQKALDEGKEVITITISSKLSGTYSSAITAAGMLDEGKVSVIDSESAAANIKELVQVALNMIDEGYSREEIANKLEQQKKQMGILLTVGTLDYLKKGGRLSNTGALIGNLLNIKPIIALKEGKLVPVDKVRGKKKALEKIIENIPEESTVINICHIYALDEALDIKKLLEEKFPKSRIDIQVLGPVVGAHLGPKALGVLFMY